MAVLRRCALRRASGPRHAGAEEPDRPADAGTGANALDWLRDSGVAPCEIFGRLGWLAALVLAVIVFYKFGDAMLGRIAEMALCRSGFYESRDRQLHQVSRPVCHFGRGRVGGWVCIRIGIIRAMFLGALLMMVTNLAFALLATNGKSFELLATVVFFDEVTGGMATTAFVAYLSSLCNIAFTATQYALLASLGNFSRIQLGSVSGWAVDSFDGDWALFFVGVAAMSIPAILLLWLLARLLPEIER